MLAKVIRLRWSTLSDDDACTIVQASFTIVTYDRQNIFIIQATGPIIIVIVVVIVFLLKEDFKDEEKLDKLSAIIYFQKYNLKKAFVIKHCIVNYTQNLLINIRTNIRLEKRTIHRFTKKFIICINWTTSYYNQTSLWAWLKGVINVKYKKAFVNVIEPFFC